MGPLEQATKLPMDLIVYEAMEDEVLLNLNLSKMAQLTNHVKSVNLNPQFMRDNSTLVQGDSKGMHLMVKCVMGSNDESTPDNHEMLNIEGHLHT